MNSIALRIAGTKQRRAGFAPLVSYGVLPSGEGQNMDRTTTIKEKPTFILKHTTEYILYTLIDRHVKAFDTDTSGILTIALAIGRDVMFANNVSPYDVLMKVYNTFRKEYMEEMSDGRDAFKDVEIDNEIFERIMSEFKTETVQRRMYAMNPKGTTGILRVPDFKLRQFFMDTQYPEFIDFSEIEIGVNKEMESSREIRNLVIPKPGSQTPPPPPPVKPKADNVIDNNKNIVSVDGNDKKTLSAKTIIAILTGLIVALVIYLGFNKCKTEEKTEPPVNDTITIRDTVKINDTIRIQPNPQPQPEGVKPNPSQSSGSALNNYLNTRRPINNGGSSSISRPRPNGGSNGNVNGRGNGRGNGSGSGNGKQGNGGSNNSGNGVNSGNNGSGGNAGNFIPRRKKDNN